MAKEYVNYQDFVRQFDKSDLKPIYVFQGPEHFLIAEALELLKQRGLPAGAADFNYDKFAAKEAEIGEVVALAQTVPFLNDRRMVILTEFQELAASAQNHLLAYLANPSPTTCLILTAEKLDSRTKLAQALKQHAEIVQCWKLFDRDVPKWIAGRAKGYGAAISLQTAAYLAELVGNDLRQLDNELKKMIAYAGAKELSADVVRHVVGDIRERDIFELVDAVSAGNVIDALRILNQLLIEGEEPLKILAMVTRQFRLLWKMKAHLADKKPLTANQLAAAVGVSPRAVENLQKQVPRFSQIQLKQGFRRLCDVDRALKSSANAPTILLEEVLIDLCLPAPN